MGTDRNSSTSFQEIRAFCEAGNEDHLPAGTVAALLDVAERLDRVRYLREGHETPETPDEDNPVPYCFECEVPWPCVVEELFQALDAVLPQGEPE